MMLIMEPSINRNLLRRSPQQQEDRQGQRQLQGLGGDPGVLPSAEGPISSSADAATGLPPSSPTLLPSSATTRDRQQAVIEARQMYELAVANLSHKLGGGETDQQQLRATSSSSEAATQELALLRSHARAGGMFPPQRGALDRHLDLSSLPPGNSHAVAGGGAGALPPGAGLSPYLGAKHAPLTSAYQQDVAAKMVQQQRLHELNLLSRISSFDPAAGLLAAGKQRQDAAAACLLAGQRMDHGPGIATGVDEMSPAELIDGTLKRRRNCGGVTELFPQKLHRMLDEAERDGLADVVSFFPHGKSFCIHKPQRFVADVMPKYFKGTRLTSFQRQLNLYGFRRINYGPEYGGYYHEAFVKGRPELCFRIKRVPIKGGTGDYHKSRYGIKETQPVEQHGHFLQGHTIADLSRLAAARAEDVLKPPVLGLSPGHGILNIAELAAASRLHNSLGGGPGAAAAAANLGLRLPPGAADAQALMFQQALSQSWATNANSQQQQEDRKDMFDPRPFAGRGA